ncbi:ABC transporter ATP-binding protein/permease [Shewanella sp. NIFS-20-20]|uniref:ABCB family ABC transporter ATP-binding protein/permease n=1 Tax=Shewanella sp. NIFS-20-20 TaxID=2853806 RepID=UPI001C444131|nr:ABC transporter ATP-binding protein/permease [Shewanella sp. NIFS-20-20]MBV7314655.1 ABC transporter ATP-binding protein/permease [Shewanella sp. NIFS-20-20]
MRSVTSTDPRPAKLHWSVISLLWPYLLEFKGRVLLALACLVAAKLATIAMPFVLKDLVNALSDKPVIGTLMVPLALVLSYGALRFISVIIGEIRDTLFGRVTERAIRRLGRAVFDHLHRLDLSFHLDRQTGGLSRDIERGTSGVSFLMRFMIFNIVPTLFEIAVVIGIFWDQYGWPFALLILLAVVAYGAFSVVVTEWRTDYVRDAAIADSNTNTRAIDSLLNYETVKYFNNEQYESTQYDNALAGWERAKRNNRLSLLVLNAGQALIIAAAMTIMMYMAAKQVTVGDMTIGDFVLVNAFMLQLFLPLNFLGFVYREIRGALANIERMFALLALKPKVVDSEHAINAIAGPGHVRFEHVGFGYGEQQILCDISFDIAPGTKVAVVGDSGAGKSTLIKLLFRFYDVSHGRISLDGVDIRDLSQQSLRQALAIVPQDTVLFNDTILENIRYGRPTASDREVSAAAEMAYLADFIQRLPQGMATKVGERGMKLSGGEKQRVAIARAILKGAPMLVFDEATSSLDSGAEQAILQAINAVAHKRTSLVVAHRLSTIVDADTILVMHGGRIVESGHHYDLLSKNGYYAKLWHIQHQQAQGKGKQ